MCGSLPASHSLCAVPFHKAPPDLLTLQYMHSHTIAYTHTRTLRPPPFTQVSARGGASKTSPRWTRWPRTCARTATAASSTGTTSTAAPQTASTPPPTATSERFLSSFIHTRDPYLYLFECACFRHQPPSFFGRYLTYGPCRCIHRRFDPQSKCLGSFRILCARRHQARVQVQCFTQSILKNFVVMPVLLPLGASAGLSRTPLYEAQVASCFE